MSLIHQVLKDLENRSKPRPKADLLMSGITLETKASDDNKKYWQWIIFASSLLTVLLLGLLVKHHVKHKITVKNEMTASTPVVAKTTPLPMTEDVPVPNNAIPTILTGITLQTQGDMTYLHFLLSQNVLYRLDADVAKHQIIITLEQAQLTTSLPNIDYSNSAISHIAVVNQANGDLKIFLTLEQNALVQRFDMNSAGKLPELQINLFRNSAVLSSVPTEEEATAPKLMPTQFVKKVVVEVSAEQQYEDAMVFSKNGQNEKSIQMLAMLNKKFPDYVAIRQSLATLLLQQGHDSQAENILQEGLNKQPDYLPFIELQAKTLSNEGKVEEALKLLSQSAPTMSLHPDYYAFLAALYQQQNQPQLAEKLYEDLLQLQPGKGVWWMGLGIALDSLDKHNEAVEAYQHADNSADLTPELKAYVETQMYG